MLSTLFKFQIIFLLLAVLACQNPRQSRENELHRPGWFFEEENQDFHPFFKEVQTSEIFSDSKTLVDCEPKVAIDSILKTYDQLQKEGNLDLKAFVLRWFDCSSEAALAFTSVPGRNVEAHINALWPVLTRPGGEPATGTRIALPHPCVVPGGRFREMYYWDSYFTMLGLKAAGKDSLVADMVDNFAWLIEQFGFVPNGTRTYYLSRSQPPFFSAMVELLAQMRGDSIYKKYLPALESEYAFWMEGQDLLTVKNPTHRRVVMLPGGEVLNRYWDDLPLPRPESYVEDLETAQKSKRPPEQVWRDLRAAAESGWDFSSRWLRDPRELATIHTTDFIPVDLNALLYNLEGTLAKAYLLKGEVSNSKEYQQKAAQRKEALGRYCWSTDTGFYFDYLWTENQSSPAQTLSAVYPLYFGIADSLQAHQIAERLKETFLAPGGLLTTTIESGQQWDAPNGWAPLQWLAIQGLRRYGQNALANNVANRWIANNLRVYKNTGKLVEKYVVTDTTLLAGGGEYALQDGFGWTNGVLLALLKSHKKVELLSPAH